MVQFATFNRLAELSEDQWGLITRSQARNAGIPPTTLARLTARGQILERVSHGVYRLVGSSPTDHLELRAAWLQLAPSTPAWARKPEQGVISHRSAASLYGLGDLPSDRHEFTVGDRKQSRRRDVRLHRRTLRCDEWRMLRGLPVTTPARTAVDLLLEHEEPDAVGQVIADALRKSLEEPSSFVHALAPRASLLGFRRDNGLGALKWLLELTADTEAARWLQVAAKGDRASSAPKAAP